MTTLSQVLIATLAGLLAISLCFSLAVYGLARGNYLRSSRQRHTASTVLYAVSGLSVLAFFGALVWSIHAISHT
jgi:hypothetical protein